MIPKPWGMEYLLFQMNDVAGWILHINKAEKTSLHCHPSKKTSLIVLDGEVKISFLSSEKNYSTGEKLIIRPGVFHSTEALSNAIILEIETPINKNDLIRLKDNYGREGKPYETISAPRTTEPYIDGEKSTAALIKKKFLRTDKVSLCDTEWSLVVLLNGGIVKNSIFIAGKGDCLTRNGFKVLVDEFSLLPDTMGLLING